MKSPRLDYICGLLQCVSYATGPDWGASGVHSPIIPIPRNYESSGIPKSVILCFIPVKGDLSWVHLFHFALTLMPLD